MKKVLLFAVVFSCSMWANAQRVTWATEAGLSAQYKELGMENVGVHPLV